MTDDKTGSSGYFLEVPAGEFIFRQNDTGDEMFIVEDGEIAIVIEKGKKEDVLTVLERGDFFGEMAILENLPRVTSAKAKTNARLLRIDRAVFDQIIRTNPEFAVRMLRALSGRLRDRESSGEKKRSKAPAASGESKLVLSVEGGPEFPLREGDNSVGRFDASTGTHPDVDLTGVDTDKTTSRRHARIICKGPKIMIQEDVGTANGTFVNGKKLEPGVAVPLEAGDAVNFGGVKTTVRPA